MCGENKLATAAAYCLRFRFRQKAAADALPAQRFRNPNLAQFAGPTPRMTRCRSNDDLRSIAQKHPKTPAIRDSGCCLVELVEPILQVFDVCDARFLVPKAVLVHYPPVTPHNGDRRQRALNRAAEVAEPMEIDTRVQRQDDAR